MAAPLRACRKDIAASTLKAMENGFYTLDNKTYTLPYSVKNTQFYNSSELSKWSSFPPKLSQRIFNDPHISILEISTIEAAQLLSKADSSPSPGEAAPADDLSISKVGVLNFASAKNPGGGFLGGAQAQEESIARSSTLYQSLTSPPAKEYYESHRKDPRGGYYSHAMIFSSNVIVFRDEDGNWVEPFDISVVTSPAVNAGLVRKHSSGEQEEKRIELVMKERMGRILLLFESRDVSKLVLGSFGTGVFQNSVSMVARLWAELLGVPRSRFASSFECVVFGILGKKTYDEFKEVFNETCRSQSSSE